MAHLLEPPNVPGDPHLPWRLTDPAPPGVKCPFCESPFAIGQFCQSVHLMRPDWQLPIYEDDEKIVSLGIGDITDMVVHSECHAQIVTGGVALLN